MKPKLLSPGDTIGLVAPSHVADPARYDGIIKAINRLGFAVKTGENFYKNTYGYSATAIERADDFNAMFRDGEVKMVFFGGGTGAVDLLPHLDFNCISKNPKIVCSYSDGTTLLNAIYAQTGMTTYYGPAPADLADFRHYDYTQFAAHFINGGIRRFESNSDWVTVCGGRCEGVLIGGHVKVFALLLSNKYFRYDPNQQYLLFMEINANTYDIRLLSTYLENVEQSHFMKNVTGLLFGHYTIPANQDLILRLERLGKRHGIPVVYCDDFGHGLNHAILPIGVRAEMNADAQTLDFLE